MCAIRLPCLDRARTYTLACAEWSFLTLALPRLCESKPFAEKRLVQYHVEWWYIRGRGGIRQ
jgi:hypothetical protein